MIHSVFSISQPPASVAYRRVLGAIGVVHFPSCYGTGYADFRELERQFQSVLEEYKHLHTTRIFAFGHSFEQGDYPDIIDPQRDIVFPPEQGFEVYVIFLV